MAGLLPYSPEAIRFLVETARQETSLFKEIIKENEGENLMLDVVFLFVKLWKENYHNLGCMINNLLYFIPLTPLMNKLQTVLRVLHIKSEHSVHTN